MNAKNLATNSRFTIPMYIDAFYQKQPYSLMKLCQAFTVPEEYLSFPFKRLPDLISAQKSER